MKGSLKKRGQYWYLTIDMGNQQIGVDEEGKPIYKRIQKKINTKCEKKPDALKFQLNILNQLENNTFVNPKNIYFTDFLADWLDTYVKNNCQYTTYQSYSLTIKTHILPYFKDKNILLQKLQPINIQKYYNYKLSEGKLSPNSILKHHANIHKALEYALKLQLVSKNAADAVILPKKEKYNAKFYNERQIEQLMYAVSGTILETPVIITIQLGLRRGEVLGLKWDKINLEEGTIYIDETVTRYLSIVTKSTKNDSSTRTLPLPEVLNEYLLSLKKRQEEQKLLFGNCYINENHVCCWDNGKPITPDFLSHKFKEILIKNNLPLIRFHDLRHSNASYLLKKGVSMKEIQIWLGHNQLSTTADIYSHVDFQLKKETAKKMNNIFKKSFVTKT